MKVTKIKSDFGRKIDAFPTNVAFPKQKLSFCLTVFFWPRFFPPTPALHGLPTTLLFLLLLVRFLFRLLSLLFVLHLLLLPLLHLLPLRSSSWSRSPLPAPLSVLAPPITVSPAFVLFFYSSYFSSSSAFSLFSSPSHACSAPVTPPFHLHPLSLHAFTPSPATPVRTLDPVPLLRRPTIFKFLRINQQQSLH